MITEALNEWKKTQLLKAQQAIPNELKTSKAQQESLKEKAQLSDLQGIINACKEVECKKNEVETIGVDVSLPKVNLDEVESKLKSLCDSITTLHLTALSPENTDENHISWDFIVHLCSSAVSQKDPSKRPYIPQCVKKVANIYNRNRNTQFLRVVHNQKAVEDSLVCTTDDFIFQYNRNERKRHLLNELRDSRIQQDVVELLVNGSDVLHDPKYASEINNVFDLWKSKTLHDVRNGKPELWWGNS